MLRDEESTVAFDFDALKPEAKRAAFAHMRLGSGGRHKKLSAKKKASVEHGGKATLSGKLTSPGSGSLKGKLSPADHDSGAVRGKLPVAKARPAAKKAAPAAKPAAVPDTPESRFDAALTEDVNKLTGGKYQGWAGMVDLRKTLDARGLSRAEQDKQLKRMSAEGKISIVPEDNRKALREEDHDAAIHIGGEPNHLVTLADDPNRPNAAPRTSAPAPAPAPKKPAAKPVEQDLGALAKDFVEMHGHESVAPRIAFLEKKKRLLPGERAQLAALKTLGKK
ncbi:hypothetical protein [Amycolatopsis eburnea]|uniref:Uncharacterized protein n=1 Tax=Amycolatopsis eburnea TaxID=2267691 RepID=A0A3R9DMY3_9PSEU|nr:hypothetical protein [Amycolatopsis eburnea]RSD22000.1 hypothetical protein EIY87_09285 [Amycolatopsis eburnea]